MERRGEEARRPADEFIGRAGEQSDKPLLVRRLMT
jgi:hypothetical protein